LSAAHVQAGIALVAALLGATLGLLKYFNYRTKRDRRAAVGASFSATVDALASDNETRRMAAAVLLRRFFDRETEQGEARTPYLKETIEVIAGMLRAEQPERLQKVLADSLRYAQSLVGADLQQCNLRNAYLGRKKSDRLSLDMSAADLFEADCTGASVRGVIAVEAVFYRAVLERAVLVNANLEKADFRAAKLSGASFSGARIGGAKFEGAEGIPDDVAWLLDNVAVGQAGAVVGGPVNVQ
jgi:hypothetical protein